MPYTPPADPPAPPFAPLSRHQGGDALTVSAASRRAFNVALGSPCPAHQAHRGEPCWTLTGDRPHPALCGPRVSFALSGRGDRRRSAR